MTSVNEAESEAAERATRDPAPAVSRALGILGLLAESDGRALSLSELARTLGIAKSSCANLCQALEDGDMIRRTSEGFGLGRRTAELGGAYSLQFNQVREFFGLISSSPTLRGEVVQIAMLDGADALYLARHEGRAPYRFGTPLGSRLPAVFSAAGNALLLSLDALELEQLLAPVLPLRSGVDGLELNLDELQGRLEVARQRGYAVDEGHSTVGVLGVAVPLPAWSPGDPPLALGAAIPSDQADQVRIAAIGTALREVAARLENPWRARTARD
ncbi:transcriptional regulator [Arthrobacter sp. MYb211]|uniref:IclR family transcriptional regulator n=1 Tax=unclassified Arthrobacter TaxID=235627 RepID=UPI000CFDB5C3|nr:MULTISPECIES: IclR family transcriptional regulator C-terminal domain-containing protein [unclassified Arthrobacter]PQZ96959.1 transcriptional regulator [Arthrobacter sp. MYb224]PQZ99149.1 transcriptional regulator [Arthrobacter sp. MYb229]PRA10476.1 transcriptional regulator [Arthrobacter sp. MYb221]PRB47534.1 transcriptional regulator [Arthrobacter sp. MYb216]PRC06046.1 transcriptional regulator [Arthrobacter sp. MYb211]